MKDQAKSTSRAIYLDVDAAQINMNKLVASAASLKQKINEGEAAGKKMVKALTQLDQVNASIKNVQNQLEKGLQPTLQQQTTLVRQLRNELARMSENDPQFSGKLASFQKQNAALAEMNSRIKTVQESGGQFSKVFTHVAEALASFFIIEKVTSGIKEFFQGSIEEADHAIEAIDNLRVSLLNVGRIDVFERLISKAQEFADKYKTLDNDDVTKVFSKLVDYGKLTEKQMTSVTEVIINYAAKQKISLEEATDVITKGLEGSGKALKTYGINMKDATDFTSRYNLIVDVLGNKIKGAEAAFEETNQGIKKGFQQRIRDLKEDVGKFLYSLTGLEEKQLNNAIAARKDANEAQVLVVRYQELSKQTKLTTSDKQELTKIITTLASKFGSSVVEVDKETGALKLNIQATKDLITQKLLLANNKAVEIAGKLNKAQEDEANNIKLKELNTRLYNEALKQTGKTQEEIEKNVSVISAGDADVHVDYRTKAEKALDPFIRTIAKTGIAAKKNRKDIEEYINQLDELGFKQDDINKLLNPQGGNAIIGKPAPQPIDTEEEKKVNELLKKYDEIKKQVGIDLGKSVSPLQGEFEEINKKFFERIELYRKLEALGKKSHEQTVADIAEAKEAQKGLSDIAFEKAEKERLAKRKKDLEALKEIGDLMKKAEEEARQGVGPKGSLPDIAGKAVGEANRDNLAAAQLAIMSATGKARLDALNKQMELEEHLELGKAYLTENEKFLIIEKYNEKRKNLSAQVMEDNVKEVLNFASKAADILSTISNIATTNENKQLQIQLKNNEIAKQSIQRQLQSKVLTTQEAASRIASIDADADKKKKALEQQQFQRNQKIQIAQAIINGAMGITAALAAMPGAADIISLGAFRALQIGFSIATTAAQVGAIASQKPAFAKGGFLPGPTHAEGGLPVINPRTGQAVAEVEGGEVILSRNTVRNNSSLVSALLSSSMVGNGAAIRPFWESRPYRSLNYSAITTGFRKYENGGVLSIPSMPSNSDMNILAQSNELNASLVDTLNALRSQLREPVNAYVTQRQLDDSNTRKAQILADARIG